MAASTYAGAICVSTNSGSSWFLRGFTNASFRSICSSADGGQLAVAGSASYASNSIALSTDTGVTWEALGPNVDSFWSVSWNAIACSSDGARLAAARAGIPAGEPVTYLIPEPVHVSPDRGATWQKTSAFCELSTSIAASADGMNLVVVANTGEVLASTDAGATWYTNNAPAENWSCVACSADGTRRVALANTYPVGRIYTYYNPAILPKPVITSWQLSDSGQFVLQATGNTNATYHVLASPDSTWPLSVWTLAGPLTLSNGVFWFVDKRAPDSALRYYRVGSP